MEQGTSDASYAFKLKFRWHVKLHLMSGVTVVPWLRVLCCYWRQIHWTLYWHRVLFLSFLSLVNTLLAMPDWFRFNRRIADQQLHSEPLFILGNPRTGTTHLHNLLSLDPAFAYATTFQAGFPSSFISLEQVGARPLLQPLLSPTRPMDAVKLTWDTPAEDEIAVCTLTGGCSFYMPLVMPCCERQLRPFLTLKGLSASQYTAWSDALIWILKKVTFRDCMRRPAGTGARPLLIKSPVHTARLRVWRQLFPQARYIYIHRHPVEVFRSSAHMVDTYFWYCYLQHPSNKQLTDYLLDQGDIMHEEYTTERQFVDSSRLVEVRFDELDADPLTVLKHIYDKFGWSDRYQALVPRFKQYCETLSDFKKNQHTTLPADLEGYVRQRWAAWFTEFRYS